MENKIVTSVFYFEGIDCPNCASKIERELNKEEIIISANINYVNQKIIVEHYQDEDVFDIVLAMCLKTESGVKLFKNKPQKMYLNHNHSHRYDELCVDIKCKRKTDIKLFFIICAIALYICASVLQIFDKLFVIRMFLFVISYLIIAKSLLIKCFSSIRRKDIFNENTLMVIASLGALIIGEGIEAIMLVLLNKIGEFFQNKAINQTKSSIEKLFLDEKSKVTLSSLKEVDPNNVKVGDIIIVKPGEKVLLDGILLSKEATLDMKSLTGEALPVNVNQNQEILSGSINCDRVIEMEVKKEYQESTFSKVKKLVEEANDKKSKSQIFITKFARIYTPIIILVALSSLLIQLFVIRSGIVASLNSMFSILVVACPCALVVSVPLCYFASIGACSKKGILVKGSNYLEALTKINTFVFDKTGTLTKGNFVIKKIVSSNKEELLEVASKVELHSTHPISLAIKKYFDKEIKVSLNSEYIEYSGKGICLKEDSHILLAGNHVLMENFNINVNIFEEEGTVVYIAKDNVLLGYIVLGDEIKEESYLLMNYLKKQKYETYLLSGDNEKSVQLTGSKLEIDNKYHSLLPNEKYEIVTNLISNNKKIAYVGDGINDSPSLKISDVGITMGVIGADISKECADVIIINDDTSKIIDLLKISKFTRKIIIQNIIVILLVKLFAIIIGASGILGSIAMFVSIFADVGICLLSILNALRILRKR